jgi:hypothetical protein
MICNKRPLFIFLHIKERSPVFRDLWDTPCVLGCMICLKTMSYLLNIISPYSNGGYTFKDFFKNKTIL